MAWSVSLTSLIPFLLPLLLQPLIVTRPPFHRGASIKRSQLSLLIILSETNQLMQRLELEQVVIVDSC
jgi:hypothetical protein